MTTQPDPPAAAMSPPAGGSVAFEDLTARARIREAAIQHFAEEGYERTTIRGIAQTAGVSPGLLRHHFGSKEELRRACDEYVSGMLRQVNAQVLADLGQATAARRAAKRYRRYIVRALADGSGTAGPIFDEMVTQTEQWLARADEARPDPPAVDRRIRAALVTAMAAGIPLLHDHVSRALGADIFEPEGDRLLALGLLDIYSHPLLDEETASAAEAGLDLLPPIHRDPFDRMLVAQAQHENLTLVTRDPNCQKYEVAILPALPWPWMTSPAACQASR
jgi:AcrR family transcriptional regulator